MKNQRILVYGLGRSGVSLSWYLLGQGMDVVGYDDDMKAYQRPDVVNLLKNEGFHSVVGMLGQKYDTAIVSPGIPEESKTLQALRQMKVPVIDEVEFGFRIVGKKILGVTGTNGKSTVTTLIGEVLKADGRNAFYGGNLCPGRPLSSALLEAPKDFYVLEISSFQLERCSRFTPGIGVLLNVTPDHLNRHKTLENYLKLKLSMFRWQQEGDFAVLNRDDELVYKSLHLVPSPKVLFSLTDPAADATVQDGIMTFRGERIMPVAELKLPGLHNVANALAVIAATRLVGAKPESIAQVLRSFSGLEHRLEFVRELDGVKYVNNSMCTNPAAAIQSLMAYDVPVVVITGGKEKNLPYDDYLKALAGRAKAVVVMGENRQRVYEGLRRNNYRAAQVALNLADAVNRAKKLAQSGDIVLFSPGFASFDAFDDFQARGRAFRDVVQQL